MSQSLLYHAFGVREGYEYARTAYVNGRVEFHLAVREELLVCPECRSTTEVIRKGKRTRRIRMPARKLLASFCFALMSSAIEKKISAGFLFALVAFVTMGWVTYRNAQHLLDGREQARLGQDGLRAAGAGAAGYSIQCAVV